MGKISELFNFNNIGGKIKGFAKWSCWISILLIWIAAPVHLILLVSNDYTRGLWWLPVTYAIAGPLLIWFGSWILYAFGEFVEDIHALRAKTAPAPNTPAPKAQTQKAPTRKFSTQTQSTTRKLNRQDLEVAVTAFLKRRVTLSEISCTLVYVIPQSTGNPQEMHLSMTAGNDVFSSLDLMLFDPRRKGYYCNDHRLALDEPWLPAEQIFSFNLSEFHSFSTEEDTSD